MTEPRPPIHPAPGDWPEDDAEMEENKNLRAAASHFMEECARLRAELARIRAALEPRKEDGECERSR